MHRQYTTYLKQDAIITIRLHLARVVWDSLFGETLAVEENISTTFQYLNI